jgi:hypothetical protein
VATLVAAIAAVVISSALELNATAAGVLGALMIGLAIFVCYEVLDR